MTTYRVSIPAETDLENIALYTQERWGRGQRNRYLLGLETKFEALAEHPTRIAERVDFNPPVRIAHYGKHLVVYVIEDAGILIVRVLHQSMDVPAQLSN